jgi:hypothetical protein
LWFAQAECSFTVKKIEAQFDRYCLVVAALPHESPRLVADLVESPITETRYDDIKERLVASHPLSDFQKAKRLFLMPPLGSRREVISADRLKPHMGTSPVPSLQGEGGLQPAELEAEDGLCR